MTVWKEEHVTPAPKDKTIRTGIELIGTLRYAQRDLIAWFLL